MTNIDCLSADDTVDSNYTHDFSKNFGAQKFVKCQQVLQY